MGAWSIRSVSLGTWVSGSFVNNLTSKVLLSYLLLSGYPNPPLAKSECYPNYLLYILETDMYF